MCGGCGGRRGGVGDWGGSDENSGGHDYTIVHCKSTIEHRYTAAWIGNVAYSMKKEADAGLTVVSRNATVTDHLKAVKAIVGRSREEDEYCMCFYVGSNDDADSTENKQAESTTEEAMFVREREVHFHCRIGSGCGRESGCATNLLNG